jgi:hypothetical protein
MPWPGDGRRVCGLESWERFSILAGRVSMYASGFPALQPYLKWPAN